MTEGIRGELLTTIIQPLTEFQGTQERAQIRQLWKGALKTKLRTRQQYISHYAEHEDHPQDVGDLKRLPLMKGIERMMREKVDAGGEGRPGTEESKPTWQNEGEGQGQDRSLES